MLDNFLNQTTMYRLTLYYLISLVVIATVLGFLGLLPFGGINLLFSTVLFIFFSWVINFVFSKTFDVPANIESVYISALILSLIIAPVRNIHDLPFIFWASVLAMSSKFIVARQKKHLFNPVALAVFLTSVFIGKSANWWIGNSAMFIPVLLGGLLIVKKIRRWDMVLGFFVAASITILAFNFTNGPDLPLLMRKTVLETPLLFFAFIMLTEPLTTPPTKNLQLIYGLFTGFLFAPQVHLGPLYTTPETALLLGNIFSYIVSPKRRDVLILKEIIKLTPDTYDFLFEKNKDFNFIPGQYVEWTLGHTGPDSRGNRRYFTIASSPTENEIRFGIKFYEAASSFKKALLSMKPEQKIYLSQLAGDFSLPSDTGQKLVFLAGGIGITPFRSMLKYLTDRDEKRDIVLMYSNKTSQEVMYKDVFDRAEKILGIKTFYSVGRFSPDEILDRLPDYRERVFYLSGPHAMVTHFEKILTGLGVSKSKIKTDYFPGFA